MKTIPLTFAMTTLLAVASAESATGVVAAWSEMASSPEYLTGRTSVDQTDKLDGETRGTILDVIVLRYNDPKKQATRQSTDGTFGDGDGLVTLDGEPISADQINTFGLRLNADQGVEYKFTNVSGSEVVLERIYFDFGRGFDTSPTTISLFYINAEGGETLLLQNSETTVHGSIADHSDFSVDLSTYAIAHDETFSLKFIASGGDSGSVLDNVALSVTAELANDCAFPVVDNWTDSGDWMGFLESSNAPWYYSSDLSGFIYVESLPDACQESGEWIYIPR